MTAELRSLGLTGGGSSSGSAAAVSDVAIPSSKLIRDIPSAATMSPAPTFSAPITGLNVVGEAAASTLAGSSRIAPNYAAPRSDTTYRITGPYQYLFGLTSQDMGAAQNTTAAGSIGPTGMLGLYEFELKTARKFEIWMRDVGVPQSFRMWVSKNGGPFMATDTETTPHTIASVGDTLYQLLPIDLGATADSWRILIAGQTFTFGGVRVESTATINYPQYPVERLLIVHDSYAATASQTYSFPQYPLKMAFELGLLPHIDAVGGTGFLAVAGDGTSFRYYRQRWAYNVAPYFSDTDPAVIFNPASINDADFLLVDSAYDTEVDRQLGVAQATFPSALLVTAKSMRVNQADTAGTGRDVSMNARLATAAVARGIPVWDPVADGTLSVATAAAYTNAGAADHPTSAGSTALGHGAAAFVKAASTLAARPTSVARRRALQLGYGTGQAAPGSGRNAPLGYAGVGSDSKVGKTQLPTGLWTPFKVLYALKNRLTGLAPGTYLLDGNEQGLPPLLAAAESDAGMIYLPKSDFDISASWTTQYRVRWFAWVPTTTAPGVTLTFALAAAGALAGGGMSTIGADSGTPFAIASASLTTGSKNGGSSGVFTAPADNYFLLRCTVSGATMAAGSVVRVLALVELTYI